MGHASPWRCARPGVGKVEGAGRTCGCVYGSERVVCQCGGGDEGWCGMGMVGIGTAGQMQRWGRVVVGRRRREQSRCDEEG